MSTAIDVDEHDETVEGLYNKKPIDRILSQQELQDIKKTIKQQDVVLNNKLGVVNQEIQKTTDLLTKHNEDYVHAHEECEKLKLGQQVRLTGDDERVIRDMTMKAVDEFMEKKPKSLETMKTVRVHFYTGSSEENGGSSAMGGEGAGSRHANFQVQLDRKIKDLSTQAAKYWGLDPYKVFFLDRDGRVVPDDMMVSDIILPPDAAPGKPTHMIKGRDYVLTLVRAETVISKEDPNEPKGEKWQDFMFNQEKLEADLQKHRIERGDAAAQLQKPDASQIPSLYDLITLGIEKKRKRQWDTKCRLFEVFVFISVLILFHFLLTPEDTWTYNMRLIAAGIRQDLTKFKPGECRNPHARTFEDISVPGEYYDWIYGPLRRSVLNNSDLSKRNLYVLAAHARKFKNISEVTANICKPPVFDAAAASSSALSDVGFVSNVSNCSGVTAAGNCILAQSFVKANTVNCSDAIGSNTGKKLYGKNATCAMLSPYCTDPLHGDHIKEVCPVTCNWCPQMCAGTPPVLGNSTALLMVNGLPVTGSYGHCNNTAPGGFCPLNCSNMYVKSSDYVCTHKGSWSTPKCLAPCPEFVDQWENVCPRTKSGSSCPLVCSTTNEQGYTPSGDYQCTDGKWNSPTCMEWMRSNGTCTMNGTTPVSTLLAAIQKCEASEMYGGVRCEHIIKEDCRGPRYFTCLGDFTYRKTPPNLPYMEFIELDPRVSCIWVRPSRDLSCTPNVTLMRPTEKGGACMQGPTVPHGGLCLPMCADGYEPVYHTPGQGNNGEPYYGNTTCNFGNLTTPFKCQEKPPEDEDCVDAAVADCINGRVRQIFTLAKDTSLLWPACRRPFEQNYLDQVEASYLPENAFSLLTGKISSYAAGQLVPLNITYPQGFDSTIMGVDPSWSDPELRAVLYNIFVYSPTMHGFFVYQMLVEFSVAGNMLTTTKHTLIDLRSPSSLEVLVYIMVIVLSFGVFLLELRRIVKPEFPDEQEKCNSWTFIFMCLPIMFVTSFALRSIQQGTGAADSLLGLLQNGPKGIVDGDGLLELYMLTVYEYYWTMVNLISLLVLNMIFFRYLLTYFPQMMYLTQMVGKINTPMGVTIIFTAIAFACLGMWFYSMFGQFLYDFRDPLASAMSTAHFAQGGFRDWVSLYWYYPHLWRAVITVSFIVFSLILRNLPIAVLFSHRKEMSLRENYSYHPMWTGQPNVPDKNGRVTFNPARGGMRWDKKDPYTPKDDIRMRLEAHGLK